MIAQSAILFFELVQIALGNRKGFDAAPSEMEWRELFEQAEMHSIVGVLFSGMEKTMETFHGNVPDIFYEWLGTQHIIHTLNDIQNQRAKELTSLFQKEGYRTCILKGQGTAEYYPHPEDRQCGDIDIWVEGDRDGILSFFRSRGFLIHSVDIKNADVEIFGDVSVEVHFVPSIMYNPNKNKKLQRFFREKADNQFGSYDEQIGYARTTIDFDLVFSMVHIYRHVFSEGIGLRQLMDYYYILMNSTLEQRKDAFDMLKSLGMANFVGGIMWILNNRMGMDSSFLLCSPNAKFGKFQLEEILISGNFGQYDQRITRIDKNRRFKRGIVQFSRNLRFLRYYPSEVLWSPVWKLWHYCWRKQKGYL